MADKIRRGQLVAPFGPGAITVIKGGVQLICAGLDHWFERDDPSNPTKDIVREEFKIEEPRLARRLGVNELLQPPDWRKPSWITGGVNAKLSIPFLRFPLWHVCGFCRGMHKLTPTAVGRFFCPKCEGKGKKRRLVQVRFAVMCSRGHLQDFPWREWVHRDATPACKGDLTLNASGASLASIKVSCSCKKERNLGPIMNATADGTTSLSTQLQEGAPFTCRGSRPWLGTSASEACSDHLRGTLLNATNIYFAPTESSVYLPAEESAAAPPDLLDILGKAPFATFLSLAKAAGMRLTPEIVRGQLGLTVARFTNEQLQAAIDCIQPGGVSKQAPVPDAGPAPFRLEEYRVLQRKRDREELKIAIRDVGDYGPVGARPVVDFLAGISLVERLRETRAFAGFGRVSADQTRPLAERKAMLWKDPTRVNEWLPAYAVFGEGIFLRFREDRLQEWAQRVRNGKVLAEERLADLAVRYGTKDKADGNDPSLGPKLVLLHTLAHLLINRLVFECGYSSASLRERLYVSSDPVEPMSGILIYTASGDSEGTMGGLVRMGKPGKLEPLMFRSIANARWCSADPVCMEMAEHGQGPDSCNLAACHSCGLVPETSCEQFNRFLDRGVVVGSPDVPELGFFWDV